MKSRYCISDLYAYTLYTVKPQYSETSLSGHSVRRPPLYRGHLCKSPELLFLYIFTSVKRPPHYKGQFCIALCDRFKEVSPYSGHLWAMKIDHYKEVAAL